MKPQAVILDDELIFVHDCLAKCGDGKTRLIKNRSYVLSIPPWAIVKPASQSCATRRPMPYVIACVHDGVLLPGRCTRCGKFRPCDNSRTVARFAGPASASSRGGHAESRKATHFA